MLKHLGRAALAAVFALLMPVVAFGASPTPDGAAGGDPRSAGEGPGFVGDPATAILLVLAIGLASVVLTYGYVRLTKPRKER
jgi:hypothetical protein